MPSAKFTVLSPVTALLVTAANLQEAATFCGGTVHQPVADTPTDTVSDPASVIVPTAKGVAYAYPASYIVQKGNKFGVIPAEIFEAIYY
jgi:hypothetical protein